jgi:hAT family C-terminal dimerisation region
VEMMSLSKAISSCPKNGWQLAFGSNTSFSQHPSPYLSLQLPHLRQPPPRRLILLRDTSSDLDWTLMSLRNSLSCHLKISKIVIQFSGGLDAARSSPTCLALPEIYCPSLVCHLCSLKTIQLIPDSILGSAVAVERIFSGGGDTISLRRSSLKPDTIRTLMLVKQHLRLARMAVQDILGD